MTGRKLGIALIAALLCAAIAATAASAAQHRVQVTLVTGQVLTLTVDVPPGGTIADALPALPAPVQSIVDLGAVASPTPTPTPTPTATASPTSTPTGTATPAPTPTPGSRRGNGHGPSRPTGDGPGGTAGGLDAAGAGERFPKPRAQRGHARERERAREPDTTAAPGDRDAGGAPTDDNPTLSVVEPGAATIGVPNFFIDKFRIPPFLLPIYQAAGIQYGVRWEVLAAINEIESDYGRNLNVSSAGAVGWMQFLPSTWRLYGVDANGDGIQDPYNPADAIFAAARYLRAAGAETDLRKAIFAYNHADWYVDSVILRARLIGGLPSNLVGSLTGLTQGRFPVDAAARYAQRLTHERLRTRRRGNPAVVVESTSRRGIEIYSRRGAPAIAVNDGRIVAVGRSARLGRYVKLQDVYGNTYTYGNLGRVVEHYPAPKPQTVTPEQVADELRLPEADAPPTQAASDTRRPARRAPTRASARRAAPPAHAGAPARDATATKQRLFAHPSRPHAQDHGGAQQVFEATGTLEGRRSGGYLRRLLGLRRDEVRLRRLRPGATVVAGTILGRVGRGERGTAPHLRFEIRPAGRGAPRIDPKPILDGWKLLETTAVYRAAGRNPFFGADAQVPSIGQVLLMGKDALARRVLADPRIQVYDCGRRDIQTGQIDRRVLATLEFLAASGFRPTVSSLHCGHSYLTASGNVSEHSTGNAVDIAAINGIPIAGHQGPGSITETVIQRLLTLQGTLEPHQIISLMTFDGADNTFAMADHADHIHVGFEPRFGTDSRLAKQISAILKPRQWLKLIDRIGEIDNPRVRRAPSRFATRAPEHRASDAHQGD